jgi:hypothetical protein
MGIPDGAHTHGHGGGPGEVVLVVLAVALLGPAVAAAALLHLVLIVMGVIVGVATAALGGLLVWRWRNWKASAARAMPPLPRKVTRAASPLPQARRPPALPGKSAGELPGGLHLHFHGVNLEDIAAILSRQAMPGHDVNRPGPPRDYQ